MKVRYTRRALRQLAEILDYVEARSPHGADNVSIEFERALGQVRSMQLETTLTCPSCGHQATETMPTDACQFFYDCRGCGTRLKPRPGDCCVYCSYGTMPCPPIQTDGKGTCCRVIV